MLRTTNKQVIEGLKAHVLEAFDPKVYGNNMPELQNLVNQIDYMRRNDRTIYATALDYVEGGGYLVYYQDVQGFLTNLLQSDRAYSDEKAWKLYCHLVARTMAQLYTQRLTELEKSWKEVGK